MCRGDGLGCAGRLLPRRTDRSVPIILLFLFCNRKATLVPQDLGGGCFAVEMLKTKKRGLPIGRTEKAGAADRKDEERCGGFPAGREIWLARFPVDSQSAPPYGLASPLSRRSRLSRDEAGYESIRGQHLLGVLGTAAQGILGVVRSAQAWNGGCISGTPALRGQTHFHAKARGRAKPATETAARARRSESAKNTGPICQTLPLLYLKVCLSLTDLRSCRASHHMAVGVCGGASKPASGRPLQRDEQINPSRTLGAVRLRRPREFLSFEFSANSR
jgi:hypothetical protein